MFRTDSLNDSASSEAHKAIDGPKFDQVTRLAGQMNHPNSGKPLLYQSFFQPPVLLSNLDRNQAR